MKRFLIIAFILIVVLIGAAWALLPQLVSAERVKEELISRVEQKTGRDLDITGALSVDLLPRLQVTMEGIAFANARWSKEPLMLQATRASVSLEWMPLLQGRIAIDSVTLEQPVLMLEIAKSGDPNWKLPGPQVASAGNGWIAAAEATENKTAAMLKSLELGRFSIEEGTVQYTDHRSGQQLMLEQVNSTARLPGYDRPASLSGTAMWDKLPLSVDVKTDSLAALLSAEPTGLTMELESELLTFSYEGTAALGDSPVALGAMAVNAPLLSRLVSLMAPDVTLPTPGLSKASLAGDIRWQGKEGTLQSAQIGLGQMQGTGQLGLSLAGSKPSVTGQLAFGQVDLQPFMQKSGEVPGGTALLPWISAAHAAVPEFSWDTTPVNFDPLRLFNAELVLSAEQLILPQMAIPSPKVDLLLNNATLKAKFHELALFGGKIVGELGVFAGGEQPRLTKRVVAQQVDMHQMLDQLYSMNELTGTGDFTVDVAATGRSQKAWVESLSGTAKMIVKEGELHGVNLVDMVRNVRAAFNPDVLERSPVTAFSELAGSMTIQQGIARTNDLRLLSRRYELFGSGSINLPQQYVAMRLVPQRVKKQPAEESAEQQKELVVPVIVEGPFTALKFRPDLKNVAEQALKDPKAAEDTVRKIRDEFKDIRDDIGGQIKGLFDALE